MNRVDKLHLYKQILWHAKRFPSRNREKVYQEIRTAFRENKNLTDEKKIRKELEVAIQGLRQLSMYTRLDPNSSRWEVTMEQEPMPKPRKD
jgi:hypothetical protein